MSIDLSVVIIGKNESKNIIRTINAVNENESLKNIRIEVLYIDSNSTDSSIDILKKQKNIQIYQIESNKYTAALARYIGSQKSSGKYILFLDADMELTNNSNIKKCLQLLDDGKVSVVSGRLPEVLYKKDKAIKYIKDRYNVNKDIEELKSPGGYFIIDKSKLDNSGNFNCKLFCNEEVELFSRLKKQGYRIVRTNNLECIHHHYLDENSKSHIERFKRGFYSSFWLAILNSIKNNCIKQYLSFGVQKRTLRSVILTLVMIIVCILSIKYPHFILIPIVYYALMCIKNRGNIQEVLFNQKNNFFMILSIAFLIKDRNIEYYVKNIEKEI
ncbi:glycosyltransferase [Romboutsia hominis]|uniref:Nucleotidyl transferase n=1 Tax=Romboutsia hominis TaxID=1507512 RepID=A0A2P2BVW2_9FIRM|nr:glycosyltransferase [Romboutsia hominis]CEI73364.1 Nucleotidyl transferase [Romboutsia hominis]